MKKLSFSFLLLFPFLLPAQQPMTLDKIVPKFDSVLTEANLLYSYVKSAETTENIAFDSIQWRYEDSLILTYGRQDTLINIVLDENGSCAMELGFVGDYSSPIFIRKNKRLLNELEDSLLKQKLEFIHHSKNDNRITAAESGFYYKNVFIPEKSALKLYVINNTDQENIFPTGSNFLLVSKVGNVENYKLKDFSHVIQEIEFKKNSGLLILNYGKSIPLISAIDICKFNLYRHNLDQVLWVYSQRNRRIFVYNPKSNEISVQ